MNVSGVGCRRRPSLVVGSVLWTVPPAQAQDPVGGCFYVHTGRTTFGEELFHYTGGLPKLIEGGPGNQILSASCSRLRVALFALPAFKGWTGYVGSLLLSNGRAQRCKVFISVLPLSASGSVMGRGVQAIE